jgi:hypothetical protein
MLYTEGRSKSSKFSGDKSASRMSTPVSAASMLRVMSSLCFVSIFIGACFCLVPAKQKAKQQAKQQAQQQAQQQAEQPEQQIFASSEAACAALLRAAEAPDQSLLLQMLGPTGREIISGGDDVEDRNSRQQFAAKYREMHRLVREPDGAITLYVGAENWPLPLRLKHSENGWYFDPVASRAEIMFRRIGRNELATIAVLQELVSAQKEYYAAARDGGAQQFAASFRSVDGKHNGLYWKASTSEPASPVGPLLGLASADEIAEKAGERRPFHGYYYRILTVQGRHAPAGARTYLVNGKLIGGFAFVAYPTEYRSSGVMTFIVDRDGVAYQKDLGPHTTIRARRLSQYDPDATWKKVE